MEKVTACLAAVVMVVCGVLILIDIGQVKTWMGLGVIAFGLALASRGFRLVSEKK
jgi:hypothetical protein